MMNLTLLGSRYSMPSNECSSFQLIFVPDVLDALFVFGFFGFGLVATSVPVSKSDAEMRCPASDNILFTDSSITL